MAIDPVCTASILGSENNILAVSTLVDGFYDIHDVCLSIPVLVNKNGVAKTVKIQLEDAEAAQLRSSADYLKGILHKLDIARLKARISVHLTD